MKQKKLIYIFAALFLLSACASHKYFLYDSTAPYEQEYKVWKSFVIVGFIAVDNNLNQEAVCPGRRIRSLNLYDSALDGLVCGATLLVYCPHTVGIECTESAVFPQKGPAQKKKRQL